jgi:hypothetical protein
VFAGLLQGYSQVPAMDATWLVALESALAMLKKRGSLVVITGLQEQPQRLLANAGITDSPGTLLLRENLQVALRELLGLPVPAFRHHLLLLEPRGDKLAKLHGAVAAPELRAHYSAEALCGVSRACGLRASAAPGRRASCWRVRLGRVGRRTW